VVLTIAANDSAGMAGLAADCRTQQALGGHHCSVVTANTAQNNNQVISVNPVEKVAFRDQLRACEKFPIAVIKVGLLASGQQVHALADFLADISAPVVLDPVLTSSCGDSLADKSVLAAIKERLIPVVTIITPNIPELELLTGTVVRSNDDIPRATEILQQSGAQNMLIKGGHGEGSDSHDYFSGTGEKKYWLSSPRLSTTNTRGTGCVLASSIATALALEYSLVDSIVIGKMAVNQGLRESYALASCAGPLSVTRFPDQQIDLPTLSEHLPGDCQIDRLPGAFPTCGSDELGLYAVVDRKNWLQRLAPVGVSTFQLRIKDLQGPDLEDEISGAIALAKQFGVKLFINDYWQLAIKFKAYGIHLGQEDLGTVDLKAIRTAGLRLGISTHCHYEVARAHGFRPSYMACGPIYPTTSKVMPWLPQGIAGLSYWLNLLDYPLVAIGGINSDSIADVAKTGVQGIAMISAISDAKDPEKIAKSFIKTIVSHQNETAGTTHHPARPKQ
jgi:hydroxymethylpyrimidine kinase / phosphomethylpyrimidine kinase / thiamine-phosphate diphosphorylase